jgi:hypothetical protein
MPKVDEIKPSHDGYCCVVRNDNNELVATFDFKTRNDAVGAQRRMKEVLARCHKVTGYAPPN